MAAEYNHQKIIFSLNSISNLPSNRVGGVKKLENDAKDLINKIFTDPDIIRLIGKWKLAWGPKIYERPGFKVLRVADNTMYVAQSLSHPNKFVVAISGTNPISANGWVVDDLEICPPVPWPFGTQSASSMGNITNGTSVGINVLLNDLKDKDTDGKDKTFVKYLADQVSNNQDSLSVTVTGHSLGGALSPATALALLDSQGVSLDEPNGWDLQSTSQIFVMPTAGPSPGDEVWRDYYDNRLGDNTDRIWNAIDIVPHAWEISMLNAIPTIYHNANPTTCHPTIDLKKISAVRIAVVCAVKNSQQFEKEGGSSIKQICPSAQSLPGEVYPKKKSFLGQALYQHTVAYNELLRTTEFDIIYKAIVKANKAKGCGFKCM